MLFVGGFVMTSRIVVVALAAVLATAGAISATSAASSDGGDHAALSAAYASEAQSLRQKAAEHELMLRRYENAAGSAKGVPFPKAALVQHCRRLVTAYEKGASEAEALAQLESRLAQQDAARR
jgi:hypothetical protein